MQYRVFDVTLYWHDGGSVFLGTVQALSPQAAQDAALAQYTRKSKAHEKEIEEGGGFQVDAVPLLPDEAVKWLARHA